MSSQVSAESWSKLSQFISLLGLGLIPLMLLRAISESASIEPQPIIIGMSFIIICLLGAIAGIRPTACTLSLSSSSVEHDDKATPEIIVPKAANTRRGHHYQCEPFSSHVLSIREGVFCAGCTGLATGAAIAIIGSFLYFFSGVLLFNALVVFWTGFAGVAVGILQHRIYKILGNTNGPFRFILNVIFVNGAFLLLVGADQLAGSVIVDVYILLLILLWIFTRIIMSKSEHKRICSQCESKLYYDS